MMTNSWEKLYSSQAPKLLGLCRRYVRDIALAEDLLHDAFLTAIKKQHTYNGDGPIEAWLRKITLNTVLLHLRQEKHLFVPDSTGVLEAADEPFNDAPDSTQDLLLGMGFGMSDLLEVLDQLPEHHRIVFNLYVLEAYPHKQIAESLGITVNTSKSHLARARKKIQELLIEKVNAMKKKDRRAAALFLPSLEEESYPVDELYQHSFKGYQIEPSPQLQAQLAQALKTPLPQPKRAVWPRKWVGGLTAAALTCVVVSIWWWRQPADNDQGEASQLSSIKSLDTSANATPSHTAATVAQNSASIDTVSAPLSTAVQPTQPRKRPLPTEPEPPVVIRKSVVQKDTVYQFQNDTLNHE